MNVAVFVQRALSDTRAVIFPDDNQFEAWVNKAVQKSGRAPDDDLQMTVRIVDEAEITQLNSDYRGKDKATNVLSFPFELPPGMPAEEFATELGDVVVCAAIVEHEAQAQDKTSEAHWAHMIVHGTLHLLGYDHETESEAQVMESLEKVVLDGLGYADPYDA